MGAIENLDALLQGGRHLRLPHKYQTRWVFSGLACALGVGWYLFFRFILFGFFSAWVPDPLLNSPFGFWADNLILTLAIAIAAHICWPKAQPRRDTHMLACAFLTVIMAFFLFGVMTCLWWYIEAPNSTLSTEDPLWLALPFAGIFFVIMGSLGSLGLPYLIASFTAGFFISADEEDL